MRGIVVTCVCGFVVVVLAAPWVLSVHAIDIQFPTFYCGGT